MKKTETSFKPLIQESKVLDVKRLEREVVHWASQRDLYRNTTTEDQLRYLKDEVDETIEALKGNDLNEIATELGDIAVFLINAMHRSNLDIATCLFLAVEKIKDRKGKMIDGKFVKEEDLPQPICPICNGTGEVDYYHDAGDHFSAGLAPNSEWRTKPCSCAKGEPDDR